jgi:hypothetical protein
LHPRGQGAASHGAKRARADGFVLHDSK